jgi:hypothetical protein
MDLQSDMSSKTDQALQELLEAPPWAWGWDLALAAALAVLGTRYKLHNSLGNWP